MTAINETDQPRVMIVVGPTGVGKSSLAMKLAGAFGGEIISADSMQVYRHMDIGTAKPTRDEQRRVRHHLIDIVNPDEPFQASLYQRLGRKAIDALYRSGKPVWVVGGTGLYIKTLTQGMFNSPKIDPSVRERLKEEAKEKGKGLLYERLKRVDPETASRLHPGDLFRTLRALEVFDSTGVPISFFRAQHGFGERPYHTFKIGLELDRGSLYRRIEERVDQMMERGFLQEVRRLMEMGYGAELKPMQSLGYKQMVQFLSKEIGWSEAVGRVKRDTRRYAKRQRTWFKADPEIRWRDAFSDRERILEEVASFLGRGG